MAYTVPLFELNYDAAEEQAVAEVVRSRWISMGPRTAELEAAFAAHAGVQHAIALGNCTAALHLALLALGIGPGDEVIVPSLTFVATVNAVGYVGATPVFADVAGRDDFSMNPAHVRSLITPRTRALLPMHYGGCPCDMGAIQQLAREYGLAVVGDAAHAPATMIAGRHIGNFGDVVCFSFFANKNMACAEGGMLVTNRPNVAEKVRLLRSHGMTTLSFDRARGHATEYDVVDRGFNYRVDDIRASLALCQLKKLPGDTVVRQAVVKRYVERLSAVEGLHVPELNNRPGSSHYIFPVLLKKGGASRRNSVRQRLAALGIQTSVHYPPAHRFSIYSAAGASLPETEWVADHEMTLPLFGGLTEARQDVVIQAVMSAMRAEM